MSKQKKEVYVMCGRYFTGGLLERKDICPSDQAVILCRGGAAGERHMDGKIVQSGAVWGFPAPEGNRLIINARAESALERRMFCDRIRRERCVVPAGGFYEWNRLKEKSEFTRNEGKTMYMAGICGEFAGQKRFVILTTKANESVGPVHERMPLILEESEIEPWILDDGLVEYFLAKKPSSLKRDQEYEQLSLF